LTLNEDQPVDSDIQHFLPIQPRDYLLLFALSARPRHGYGLIKDVLVDTAGAVTIDPANLYRSIKRLTKDGLVMEADAPVGEATEDERRRYYGITPLGQRVVRAEATRLENLTMLARERNLI
jgi:DNA-binding PadR family transcriptional regulator